MVTLRCNCSQSSSLDIKCNIDDDGSTQIALHAIDEVPSRRIYLFGVGNSIVLEKLHTKAKDSPAIDEELSCRLYLVGVRN